MALLCCLAMAAVFVGLLYVSTVGRGNRDEIPVIKARLLSVFAGSVVAGIFTWLLLGWTDFVSLTGLGVWSLPSMLLPLGMTMTLFLGPLVQDTSWSMSLDETIHSWHWWRNFVCAPIVEEWVFRSCMIAILYRSSFGRASCILLPPLIFGVAHGHHVFSMVRDRGASVKQATAMVGFQIFYTTLFGAMASYSLLLTGCIVGPILSHTFCNAMGFPDFQGALDRPRVMFAYVVGVVGYFGSMYLLPSNFMGASPFVFLT